MFQKDVKSISLSTLWFELVIVVWFQKDVKSISLSTNAKSGMIANRFQKDVKSISLSTYDAEIPDGCKGFRRMLNQ